MQEGLIVRRSEPDPGSVPALSWYGVLTLHCDGKFTHFMEASDGSAR